MSDIFNDHFVNIGAKLIGVMCNLPIAYITFLKSNEKSAFFTIIIYKLKNHSSPGFDNIN